MSALNVVYNEDCLPAMHKMADNEFDLAVVDPPYGIGMDGQHESYHVKKSQQRRKEHVRKNWDAEIPPKEYFDELFRVSKNQIIWGGNYFVKYFSEGHKGWIVWDKGQHGMTMSDCELAYSSFDRPTRIFVQNRVALLYEGTIHPTQKPIALYQWLFANYAKPGDKILDTHVGSGSSRIAAYNAQLDFVGFEIDSDYWQAQETRFEKHVDQLNIFIPLNFEGGEII